MKIDFAQDTEFFQKRPSGKNLIVGCINDQVIDLFDEYRMNGKMTYKQHKKLSSRLEE